MAMPRTVLFFEDWNKSKLEFDDILVQPEHEPVNPEEEEDIVPDQHAAFGIAKSQQNRKRTAAWKDLALRDLLYSGPDIVSSNEVLEFPNFSEVRHELSLVDHDASNNNDVSLIESGSSITPVIEPDPRLSPESLLLDARANARRAAMVTPTYNNDAQHVTTRNRTNALRSSRLASGTQRRRAPR